MLQLRMQEPHALFEPVPTQKKFSNHSQWAINKKFYYELGNGHATGSGEPEAQTEYEEEPEGKMMTMRLLMNMIDRHNTIIILLLIKKISLF